MLTLKEIRERKAAKVAEARSLLDAANGRPLTNEENSKWETIKNEITDLEAQEQRAQFLADQERRSVATLVDGQRDSMATLEQRASLVSVLRAATEGKALTGADAELHAELERRHGAPKHGGILVPLSAFEKRANTTTSAGDLVGTDHRADQFIGPLRASLLVKRLGLRTLSGLHGDVSIPKYGTGLSTGWVTEGNDLAESAMTFQGVTLSPKHVGGITEMSRQLIQQSAPAIEDLVRDDLSFAIAAAVDAAIVAGTGANGQPQGIIGRSGVQTTVLPTSWNSLLDIEQLLRAVNVSPSGWYTTTAVLTALRKVLKSTTAGSEYIATQNSIGDLPASASNAAPSDVAILGDWSQVLVGQWNAVELLVNPFAEAPYRRGGVLVRAFSTIDVQCRHEQAFVVASKDKES